MIWADCASERYPSLSWASGLHTERAAFTDRGVFGVKFLLPGIIGRIRHTSAYWAEYVIK